MKIIDKFKKSLADLLGIDANASSSFVAFLSRIKGNKKDFYYGVVFSCVDAIATNVASANLRLYKKVKCNGQIVLEEEKEDNELMRLISRPNSVHTKMDLLYLTSAHIDVWGESYWYIVRSASGRKVLELWPLEGGRIVPVVDDSGTITAYVYKNKKGKKVELNPDEVVPFVRPNPFSLVRGVSTIEMARREIEGDLNAIDWNKAFFENGATPSGVLATDGVLNEETFHRLQRQWKERYAGKENAYKVLILEGGLKYQPITLSQKDMDFIQQRRFTRDQILAIFKVPKTVVAITDDVNRANAEASEYVFAKRTIKPRLALIEDKLNNKLLKLLGLDDKYVFRFDDPVPKDKELELRRKEVGVNRWMTINEVRAEEGLPAVDGGDQIYMRYDLMPMASSGGEKAGSEVVKKGRVSLNQAFLYRRRRALVDLEKRFRSYLLMEFNRLVRSIRENKGEVKTSISRFSLAELTGKVIPDFKTWKGVLVELLFKLNLDVYEKGREVAHDVYGFDIDWDMEYSGVVAVLRDRAQNIGVDVADNLLKRAREVIARYLEEEPKISISKLREEVARVLDEEKEWRVERIVQTELMTAFNRATTDTFKSSGLVKKIKWITAEDEMTCEVCKNNHNQVIELGKGAFNSGHSEPPAHPNCRCVVVPYHPEFE